MTTNPSIQKSNLESRRQRKLAGLEVRYTMRALVARCDELGYILRHKRQNMGFTLHDKNDERRWCMVLHPTTQESVRSIVQFNQRTWDAVIDWNITRI